MEAISKAKPVWKTFIAVPSEARMKRCGVSPGLNYHSSRSQRIGLHLCLRSYAGARGVLESCSITDLLDDALRIQEDALARQRVTVVRNYMQVDLAPLDKTRVMQVLVNLIENAGQAMEAVEGERTLGLAVHHVSDRVTVQVSDSGCGIAPGHLEKIFSHGFTTKPGGHGFGLHSCALAAMEMGGTLTGQSGGMGTGSTFTLSFPLMAGEMES